jgi:hypothetical protein
MQKSSRSSWFTSLHHYITPSPFLSGCEKPYGYEVRLPGKEFSHDSFRRRLTPEQMSVDRLLLNPSVNAKQGKPVIFFRQEMKLKTQEHIKHDGSSLQTDHLLDLPVTNEQADQTTAGAYTVNGKLYVATNVGVY